MARGKSQLWPWKSIFHQRAKFPSLWSGFIQGLLLWRIFLQDSTDLLLIACLLQVRQTQQSRKLVPTLLSAGTTGQPKAVWVPHECILSNLTTLMIYLSVTENDEVMMVTSINFDPSLIDIGLALSTGACLCLIDSQIRNEPNGLTSYLLEHSRASILQCTPTLLRNLGRKTMALWLARGFIRALMLGGEECPSRRELNSWMVRRSASIRQK